LKRIFLFLAAAISFLAVGLVILMVVIISNGGVHMTSGGGLLKNMELTDTKTISLADIDTIKIKYYSDDIKFYAGEGNELVVKEYKNFDPGKNHVTEVSTDNHMIAITGYRWNGLWNGIGNHRSRVEVYLPEGFSGDLSVAASSGDISSDILFKVAAFSASCSSGDIVLKDITAANINIAVSSGDITLQKAEGNLSVDASSGDIKIQKAIGEFSVVATSGDIKIRGLSGSGNIESSSGDADLTLDELTGDIDMVASSGDISLMLPENMSFHFKADVSSGDIDTSFDDKLSYDDRKKHASGDVGANAEYNVNMEASSGDITVRSN
jgi:lia operon protein LiaG